MEELLKYAKALVALQVYSLKSEEDRARVKLDLLLAKAGFTTKEVAALLGKSHAAAQKAVSRAKKE